MSQPKRIDWQLQVNSSCSEKPLRRALAASIDAGAQYVDSSHVIDVIRMDLEDCGLRVGGTCIYSSEMYPPILVTMAAVI
jgi:hypothetical protein